MTNCLFFGDSLTYGEYDGICGGYADILKRYCHDMYSKCFKEVNVFNLGIGGETTEGLINRIEIELRARISPVNNLIFISYGANDLAIKNGAYIVPITAFRRNIETAISISLQVTKSIFLISILPISETIENETTPSGKLRSDKAIKQFNDELFKISKDHNINYIDIYSGFQKDKETLLSKDGIHPNQIGYMKIAEHLKPILKTFL